MNITDSILDCTYHDLLEELNYCTDDLQPILDKLEDLKRDLTRFKRDRDAD